MIQSQEGHTEQNWKGESTDVMRDIDIYAVASL